MTVSYLSSDTYKHMVTQVQAWARLWLRLRVAVRLRVQITLRLRVGVRIRALADVSLTWTSSLRPS